MSLEILVIDNHPPTAEAIRTALIDFDVVVRVVDDGARGLIEAEKSSPRAIFLGLELPPKNYGYVVCQRLKKSSVTASIPVLLCFSTASDLDIQRHKSLKHHADAYVRKPLAPAEIASSLDRLLGPLPRAPERAAPGDGAGGGESVVFASAGTRMHESREFAVSDDDILFDEEPPRVEPTAEKPRRGEKRGQGGRAVHEIELDVSEAQLPDLSSAFETEPQTTRNRRPAPAPARTPAVAPEPASHAVASTADESLSSPQAPSLPWRDAVESAVATGGTRPDLDAEIERLHRVAETLRNELEEARLHAGGELDAITEDRNAIAAKLAEVEATLANEREQARADIDAAVHRGDEEKARADGLVSRVRDLEAELSLARDRAAHDLEAERQNARNLAARLDQYDAEIAATKEALERALQVRERIRRALQILGKLTEE